MSRVFKLRSDPAPASSGTLPSVESHRTIVMEPLFKQTLRSEVMSAFLEKHCFLKCGKGEAGKRRVKACFLKCGKNGAEKGKSKHVKHFFEVWKG